MGLVTLGEIIEQSKSPGILGISDRAQILRYISRALDLTIFKETLTPPSGLSTPTPQNADSGLRLTSLNPSSRAT